MNDRFTRSAAARRADKRPAAASRTRPAVARVTVPISAPFQKSASTWLTQLTHIGDIVKDGIRSPS